MRESFTTFIESFRESFKAWIRNVHVPKNKRKRTSQFFKKLMTKHSIQYAIKTGVAIVLSYTFSSIVLPSYAFWAPISTIIVMQVSVASSVSSSLDRIIGTVYGAVLGLAAHFIFTANTFTLMLGLAVSTAFCALLLLWNPRYRLAGITAITIVLVMPTASASEIMIFSGTMIFHIVVGILTSLLVSVLLWPVSGAEELMKSVKRQYLLAADSLEAVAHAFLDERHHIEPNFLDSLHYAIPQNRTHYRQTKEYEAINIARYYAELEVLITGLEQISVYLSSLLDALDSEAEPIEVLPMKEELMSLATSASSGLRWIASHTPQQTLPEVRWFIDTTSIRLADLRNENSLKFLSLEQLVQVLSFYNAMNHLAETVANLEEQIDIITARTSVYHNRKKKLMKIYRVLRVTSKKIIKKIC